jgi:hypothetical protein
VALWGRDRPAGLEAHVRASAIAAHIHLGKTGKAGNVVVPLCANAKCKSGVHGSATLTAAVLKALTTDGTYVNVHTAKNPNGEIRGQVARSVRLAGGGHPHAYCGATHSIRSAAVGVLGSQSSATLAASPDRVLPGARLRSVSGGGRQRHPRECAPNGSIHLNECGERSERGHEAPDHRRITAPARFDHRWALRDERARIPEYRWSFGYEYVIGLIVFATYAQLVWFRRKR